MFKDKGKYFQIEEFEKYEVDAFFTTKEIGDIKNFLGNTEENKKNFFEKFGVKDKIVVFAKQGHTDKIIDIKEDTKDYFYENVDGFITKRKNIILITKHADCLPIYFYDTKNFVIGICHSGWKGTFQEIGIRALELMEKNYNSKREDVLVGVGIGISCKNYEVGEEFYENFKNKFSEDLINKTFIKINGKWHFDNLFFNIENLIKNGILKENLIYCEECTYGNKRFHSFRRDKSKDRNIGMIYFK